MSKDKFYCSINWRNLRAYKLSINYYCENIGCKEFATEVHHEKDKKYFPGLALEISNLKSLCKSCHSSITAKNVIRKWEPLNLMFD
jgi:5-methylcytosine-specific restriction endonuclease McrA